MTELIIPRRQFLLGIGALLAAPAIVRAESLMKVRLIPEATFPPPWKVVTPDWYKTLRYTVTITDTGPAVEFLPAEGGEYSFVDSMGRRQVISVAQVAA